MLRMTDCSVDEAIPVDINLTGEAGFRKCVVGWTPHYNLPSAAICRLPKEELAASECRRSISINLMTAWIARPTCRPTTSSLTGLCDAALELRLEAERGRPRPISTNTPDAGKVLYTYAVQTESGSSSGSAHTSIGRKVSASILTDVAGVS